MRFRSAMTLLGVTMTMAACTTPDSPGGRAATLETDAQKASYAIGLDLGRNLQPAEGHLDMDAFMSGIRTAMSGGEPTLPREELNEALQNLSQTINDEQMAERQAAGSRNLEEGATFLAENATKEGVQTTDSGLQYEVLQEGDGASPDRDDTVVIHYHGMLLDGTVFDSSVDRGQPATFGVGQVIPGFTEALTMMNVGDKYRVWIPSEMAYGENGSPPAIPPNATLIFEIELLEIQE